MAVIITKEGELLKYRNMLSGWSKRYCKLDRNYFHYFNSKFDSSPVASVVRGDIVRVGESSASWITHEFSFEIVHRDGTTWHFRTTDQAELALWMTALNSGPTSKTVKSALSTREAQVYGSTGNQGSRAVQAPAPRQSPPHQRHSPPAHGKVQPLPQQQQHTAAPHGHAQLYHHQQQHPPTQQQHPHTLAQQQHPHAQQQYPHAQQQHPHAQQQHPHAQQQYPHAQQQYPHAQQQYPHAQQQYPHAQQQPIVMPGGAQAQPQPHPHLQSTLQHHQPPSYNPQWNPEGGYQPAAPAAYPQQAAPAAAYGQQGPTAPTALAPEAGVSTPPPSYMQATDMLGLQGQAYPAYPPNQPGNPGQY